MEEMLVEMYNYQEDKEEIASNEKRDKKIIENGRIVEDGLRGDFWQEIIGPQLHQMISSAGSRQREDGRWIAGHSVLPTSTNDERTYAAGYQSALMEFSNSILDFVNAKNKIEKRMKQEKEAINNQNPTMMEEY
jgi:hypothetical protein